MQRESVGLRSKSIAPGYDLSSESNSMVPGVLLFFILASTLLVGIDTTTLYGQGYVPIPFITVVISVSLSIIRLYMYKTGITKRFLTNHSLPSLFVYLFFLGQWVSVVAVAWIGWPDFAIHQYMKTGLHLALYPLLLFTVIELVDSLESLENALKMYVGLGVLVALGGLVQFILITLFPSLERPLTLDVVSMTYTPFFRATSIYPEPSWFGFSLLDWLGIAIGFFLLQESQRWRWAITLFVLAILATVSFAALFGLLVYLGLFYLLLRGNYVSLGSNIASRRVVLFLLAGLALLLAAGLLAGEESLVNVVPGRMLMIARGQDPSLVSRLTSIEAAFRVWLEHPLFGVGLGNVRFYITDHLHGWRLWWALQNPIRNATADSPYAVILAESGIVGFSLLILMIWALMWLPHRYGIFIWQPGTHHSKLHILVSALWLVVARNLIDYLISGVFLWPRFWLALALYLAAVGLAWKNRQTERELRISSQTRPWSRSRLPTYP